MDNNMGKIKKELGDFRALMREIPSLVVAFFVVSVIMMNLLANKELFVTEYVAIDCGTTLSWISFLCMDIVCMRFGTKAAFKLSAFAVAVNFVCCIIFKLLSLAPGNWGAYYDAKAVAGSASVAEAVNDALNSTIGGCWYVVVGSCIAMLVGSLVNSGVFHIIEKANKKGKGFKAYALRSYISTFIGQLFDNLVFTITVSYFFFGWSIKQVVICSIVCAIFELLCEVVFSPLGYKIVKVWEREGVGLYYQERAGKA